jgi:hypothetical protein
VFKGLYCHERALKEDHDRNFHFPISPIPKCSEFSVPQQMHFTWRPTQGRLKALRASSLPNYAHRESPLACLMAAPPSAKMTSLQLDIRQTQVHKHTNQSISHHPAAFQTLACGALSFPAEYTGSLNARWPLTLDNPRCATYPRQKHLTLGDSACIELCLYYRGPRRAGLCQRHHLHGGAKLCQHHHVPSELDSVCATVF